MVRGITSGRAILPPPPTSLSSFTINFQLCRFLMLFALARRLPPPPRLWSTRAARASKRSIAGNRGSAAAQHDTEITKRTQRDPRRQAVDRREQRIGRAQHDTEITKRTQRDPRASKRSIAGNRGSAPAQHHTEINKRTQRDPRPGSGRSPETTVGAFFSAILRDTWRFGTPLTPDRPDILRPERGHTMGDPIIIFPPIFW
jgi:hypothetical protein